MFAPDYKEESNLIMFALRSDGEDKQKASIIFANGTYYRAWYFDKFPIKSHDHLHKFIASWEEDKPEKSYWKKFTRSYGFTLLDGVLHIDYGIQNSDWSRENKDRLNAKSIIWVIPWLNREFHQSRVMDDRGLFIEGTEYDYPEAHWESFLFKDYDGEEIIASCFIEKREWFRWTGILKHPAKLFSKIERYTMEITFGKETGKKKGSWKGGTIGHSIELETKDELLIDSFKRYCLDHDMKFIKKVA